MRYAIACVSGSGIPMKASPQLEQLSDSLNLRLTREQREGLKAAVLCTPGAASPSGVARRAIDDYLTRVLRPEKPT